MLPGRQLSYSMDLVLHSMLVSGGRVVKQCLAKRCKVQEPRLFVYVANAGPWAEEHLLCFRFVGFPWCKCFSCQRVCGSLIYEAAPQV